MKTREQADVGGDDAVWKTTIGNLLEGLDAAWERSILPEEVPYRAAVSDFFGAFQLS